MFVYARPDVSTNVEGPPTRFRTATQLFMRSASQGHLDAIYTLATLQLSGADPVERDISQAVRTLTRLATTYGHPDSLVRWCRLSPFSMFSGDIIRTGARYFNICSSLVQTSLANFYAFGSYHHEVDKPRALRYATRALNKGSLAAMQLGFNLLRELYPTDTRAQLDWIKCVVPPSVPFFVTFTLYCL